MFQIVMRLCETTNQRAKYVKWSSKYLLRGTLVPIHLMLSDFPPNLNFHCPRPSCHAKIFPVAGVSFDTCLTFDPFS